MDYTCANRRLTVHAAGVVNAKDVTTLNEILATLAHVAPPHEIVLECQQVTNVDANGLNMLMDLVHQIPAFGHELYLSNAPWLERVLASLDPEVELSQVS